MDDDKLVTDVWPWRESLWSRDPLRRKIVATLLREVLDPELREKIEAHYRDMNGRDPEGHGRR